MNAYPAKYVVSGHAGEQKKFMETYVKTARVCGGAPVYESPISKRILFRIAGGKKPHRKGLWGLGKDPSAVQRDGVYVLARSPSAYPEDAQYDVWVGGKFVPEQSLVIASKQVCSIMVLL